MIANSKLSVMSDKRNMNSEIRNAYLIMNENPQELHLEDTSEERFITHSTFLKENEAKRAYKPVQRNSTMKITEANSKQGQNNRSNFKDHSIQNVFDSERGS